MTCALRLQVVRVMPFATEPVVELVCQVPWRVISAPLAYNALLVIICSCYAFKTRHLPDNFNEARFITFCVRGPSQSHTRSEVIVLTNKQTNKHTAKTSNALRYATTLANKWRLGFTQLHVLPGLQPLYFRRRQTAVKVDLDRRSFRDLRNISLVYQEFCHYFSTVAL